MNAGQIKIDSILIVDDQVENLKVLTKILKKEGYHLRVAMDGEQALESVKKEIPDLILLDIMMPKIDGYEVCRRLKKNSVTSEIPIIFVSALNETFNKVNAFEIGAVDYIQKPFQYEETIARINTHLELNRIKKNLDQLVSERTKELIRSESIARTLLNTPSDMVYLLTNEGMIIDCNKTVLDHYSLPREEIIGSIIWEFYPEDVSAIRKKRLEQVFSSGKSIRIEDQRDGVWYDSFINPIFDEDGSINSVAVFSRDITFRKTSEIKLKNYNIELEKKVDERTEELKIALENEKELNLLKSKFVSIASHEFRTPLSAISFSAGFIKKYWDKLDEEERQKKLDKIEIQVDHMTDLLNDVLTLGKTESGEVKIEYLKIDFIEFFKSLIEEVNSVTDNSHQLNFKTDLQSLEIMFDEKIGRNIFLNILTNAVKFSPDTDKVDISIQSENSVIQVEIKDYGIGIKPEDQERIFTAFYRTDDVGSIQGTGLGLAIVKESVSLLKGKLTIDSEPEKGTTFIISLPKIKYL